MALSAEQARHALQTADLLYDQASVEAALDTMAAKIRSTLEGKDPILLCVMNGGLVPAAGLFMRLKFPMQLDYLHASRYQGRTRARELKWLSKPSLPLSGRTVLIVDDILDEGLTLAAIIAYCRDQGAEAVYTAVLIKKLHNRCVAGLAADFIGLNVEDRYVFGYGMDYYGYLRNANGIYAIQESKG